MNLLDLPFELVQHGLHPHLDPGSKAALWLVNSSFRKGPPPKRLEPNDYCHSTIEFYLEFHRRRRYVPAVTEMQATAGLGNLSLLRHLVDSHTPYGDFLDSDLCKSAAAAGSLPCLQYLLSKGWELTSKACHQAALNGHFECLKWLREKECPWDTYATSGAAEMGHLEVLKYCLENQCPVSYHAAADAVMNGHVDCFKALIKRDPNIISNETVGRIAAKHGRIRFLKRLRRRGKLIPDYSIAIQHEQIEVVKYFHKHGYSITEDDYLTAINTKNLKFVRLLDSWQVARHPRALERAVVNEDFPMVQYLHQTGATLESDKIPVEAVRYKSSAILEYLHKRGLILHLLGEDCISHNCLVYLCSLGYRPTIEQGIRIVSEQNIETLRLYHRHAGVLTERMAIVAVSQDKVEHLKFLIEWGCPYSLTLYETAIKHKARVCIHYIRPLFAPIRRPRAHSFH